MGNCNKYGASSTTLGRNDPNYSPLELEVLTFKNLARVSSVRTARALLICKHGRNGVLEKFDDLHRKRSRSKNVDPIPTPEERDEILRLFHEENLAPSAIYGRMGSRIRLYRITGVLKGGAAISQSS
jgi:hypothetical protein